MNYLTRLSISLAAFASCAFFGTNVANAQDENQHDADDRSIPTIDRYDPVPALRVAKSDISRASFPAIDIHGHFGFRLKGDATALNKYVQLMSSNNISLSVSLDCVLGSEEKHLAFLKPHDLSFLYFCHIDFVGSGDRAKPETHRCNQSTFARETCLQLQDAKRKGICGLKFFKRFGLGHKNADGSLIKIDDRRFDPIWSKCGELEIPVIIHTADPAAFFQPTDQRNERFEELLRHPGWSFADEKFPSRD